jgi:phage-related protein
LSQCIEKPCATFRGSRARSKSSAAFPEDAQDQATDALTVIAEGDTPEIAKPMTGLGSGIWELAIKEREKPSG